MSRTGRSPFDTTLNLWYPIPGSTALFLQTGKCQDEGRAADNNLALSMAARAPAPPRPRTGSRDRAGGTYGLYQKQEIGRIINLAPQELGRLERKTVHWPFLVAVN